MNCDLPFANVDRLMANYSIDIYWYSKLKSEDLCIAQKYQPSHQNVDYCLISRAHKFCLFKNALLLFCYKCK